MERVQNRSLPGIKGLRTLALLLKPDHNFVRIPGGNVADRLDDALAQTFFYEAAAKLIDRRSPGKPDINQRTTFEINAVVEAALSYQGNASDHQ